MTPWTVIISRADQRQMAGSLIMACGLSFQPAAADFSVELIASGLDRPLFAASPNDDSDRVFVAEQHTGRIRIYSRVTSQLLPQPFLDLAFAGPLKSQEGILGIAFHPDYASNGFLYVNTTLNNQSVIRRYEVSASVPDLADPLSAHTVLVIDQPRTDHNSSWLGFGPDGYLYIASGDGGGANDPDDNGQNKDTLLGAMLRIDTDGDDFPADPDRNYAIPSDNPFVGEMGADEIWAYGLRNPWRPSFDRETGDLFIADVGQAQREEINRQLAGSAGGQNYGWDVREGTIGSLPADGVDPVYEYEHGFGANQGYSVTGGYVYRGPVEELQGKYFFADYVSEQIWSINPDGSGFTNWTSAFAAGGADIGSISSFGEDADGNLYITDLNNGKLFRVSLTGAASGDINGDGKVDAADVLLGIRIVMGDLSPTVEQTIRGDVAPVVDGEINISDIIVIQRIALGLQ